MDPQKRRSLNGMTPMSTSPGHLSSILEEKYSPTYGVKRGNYNIAALTSSLNVSNDLNVQSIPNSSALMHLDRKVYRSTTTSTVRAGGGRPGHSTRLQEDIKKSRISQACVICRKKKIKCDGLRPSCGYCLESNFPCVYSEPKRRGPARRMPFIFNDCKENSESNGGPTSSPTSKKTRTVKSHSITPLTSHTTHGLETPVECSRHFQHAPLTLNSILSYSSTKNGPSTSLFPSTSLTPPLSDKITSLCLWDKSKRACYVRNLGPSSGIQYLHPFFSDFNDGILTINEPHSSPFFGIDDASRDTKETVNPYEMPIDSVQTVLCDFYFSFLRPFFPIFDQQQISMLREDENRTSSDFFVLHSFYAFCSLYHYRLHRHVDPSFSCPILHLKKAKLLLSQVLDDLPSINNTCGLLFLAITESGYLQGNSWMYAGMAIRMAQEIGLHLDFERLSIRSNLSNVQLLRGKLVWWSCIYLDRVYSVILGRICTIHELELELFLNEMVSLDGSNEENVAKTQLQEEVVDPNPSVVNDFAIMLKLVYIQGNISNSINALKPLDVHQIHLHSLSLEKWLAELPLNLQFSFKTQEATSPFALHLNLLYYFTVLMLYRPCLRPSSEYPANFSTNATSICITTIKAIIVILEVAHSHSILNALSIFSIHSLLMCGTTLYIIFTNTSVNVPFSSLYEFASKLLNFMKEVLPLWPVLGYLADLHTKMLHSLLSGAFLTKHESSLDNQPTLSKSFTALRHSKVVLPPTTLSKEKSFSLKPRTAFMCPQSSLYPSTTPAKVSTLHPSSSTSSSYFSNSLSSNISTTSVCVPSTSSLPHPTMTVSTPVTHPIHRSEQEHASHVYFSQLPNAPPPLPPPSTSFYSQPFKCTPYPLHPMPFSYDMHECPFTSSTPSSSSSSPSLKEAPPHSMVPPHAEPSIHASMPHACVHFHRLTHPLTPLPPGPVPSQDGSFPCPTKPSFPINFQSSTPPSLTPTSSPDFPQPSSSFQYTSLPPPPPPTTTTTHVLSSTLHYPTPSVPSHPHPEEGHNHNHNHNHNHCNNTNTSTNTNTNSSSSGSVTTTPYALPTHSSPYLPTLSMSTTPTTITTTTTTPTTTVPPLPLPIPIPSLSSFTHSQVHPSQSHFTTPTTPTSSSTPPLPPNEPYLTSSSSSPSPTLSLLPSISSTHTSPSLMHTTPPSHPSHDPTSMFWNSMTVTSPFWEPTSSTI